MNGSKERKHRQVELNRLLGRHLATLRSDRKLSQVDVAQRMDVQRPLISKIENGHRALNAMELVDYAHALDMEPLQLYNDICSITVEYDGY